MMKASKSIDMEALAARSDIAPVICSVISPRKAVMAPMATVTATVVMVPTPYRQ